jgi:protein-S-isoprenylcysteine O-methyltransferase Ste14
MAARVIIQSAVWYGVFALLLFLPAGTLAWPGAWAFLVEMAAVSLVTGRLLARHDPALLRERLGAPIQQGQSAADKIVLCTLILLIFGWLVLMALDAVRFAWSSVPIALQAVGALAILLCMAIGYRTMRENSFAAPVVRIQAERGHHVITTGPYRHVRHPLYAGALFFFAGTPLLLGSWYGLAAAPVLVALLAIRIVIEERTLLAALDGYADYAARVRYRLIPRVW